ncbi:MAG: acetyl-CoA carboxylase biotin carboxyl carrier protein [Alphaproteobacteria bacterium]|nr:acetyl-CoA carboxylase biotin carboxyl carrier protein [Alphaproteobacteria bacterium]
MEYEKIKQLIDDFGNSKLSTISLYFPDGTKISMEKNDKEVVKVENNHIKETTETTTIVPEEKLIQEGNIVKSPMVGTFYIKPAPNAEPYVEIGKKVNKGDVLCIIEAMKLMNEIESEFTGEIKEILVKDGDTVEYGKPLFRIV